MNQVKSEISELDNKLKNISDEKFLFLFSPEVKDDCIFGLNLILVVRIISIIVLLSSITFFVSIFSDNSFFEVICDICSSVIFLIIAFYLFYSTINLKYEYGYISYIIYSVFWIISLLYYCYKSIMTLFSFLNIFGSDFLTDNIFDILSEGIVLAIYLYFVWAIYCYIFNLKKGRL